MTDTLFFDEESELLQNEIPPSNLCRIKISFNLDFDIGQSYVTSKIEDRDGNIRKLNIQPGTRGIKLQSDLIRVKNNDEELPSHNYVRTSLKEGKTLVRKLPIIGTSDWLLIFEDDLFVLAVKDQYDEIEILG